MTEADRTSSATPPAGQAAQPTGQTAPPAGQARSEAAAVTGWTGWVAFAGVMMIILGVFQIIEGLVALIRSGYYLVRADGLVINVDYSAWGWVHLILGVLAVLAGLGLFAGNMAARVVGVILAAISAIVNLGFLAAYPLWSLIVIAIDIIVIYAIVVHGREMQRI
jgi:hypothetical protein